MYNYILGECCLPDKCVHVAHTPPHTLCTDAHFEPFPSLLRKCMYSGTWIIRPPMGQVLLATIRRWPEYNVNSIKRFAHLWHKWPYYRVRNYKCAMNNTNGMNASTTKSKWVVSWTNRYTRTRFLNRGIGSCRTSTIYAVCEAGMAPREGSNGLVRIGGGSFQGSPPRLSRGYRCRCKTLSRLTLQH